MRALQLLAFFILLFFSKSYAGVIDNTVPATLKSAMVYRSGAELSHTAKATLEQGNNNLIIEGISNTLDINSLQFGSDGNVTVMSVEFATNYLKPSLKSPLVKRLEDSIEAVGKDLAKLQVMLKTNNDLLALLNANKEIRGAQTGLSVAELMKMMDYYKAKSLEIQNEIAQYTARESELKASIGRLRNQLTEEETKNTKTTGRLVLQLFSTLGGPYNFTISYLTRNAHWTPHYDLRVASVTKPISLVYRAKIVQSTGLDWKQVKLSLSTSTPNQHGEAPVLKSWFLSYVDLHRKSAYRNKEVSSSLPGLVAGVQADEVVATEYASAQAPAPAKKYQAPVYIVNGEVMDAKKVSGIASNYIKIREFLNGSAATAIYGSIAAGGAVVITLKGGLEDFVSVADNELNVVFDIDLPYDMPGNGKEQTVVLKEYNVPASYRFYAVPKMDKEAYLLADAADWEQLNLLPGEANIIFEGTYVGKSFIDPANTLDTLTLTLGRDKRVVVKREKLVDFSSVKFLGSNKKQVFTYELTVKNNKKEKISMLLKDQFPLSTNKDIEVELLEFSGAEIHKDLGVLNWNLELASGESRKLKISYSVKYPKDQTININ
ncbi:MAG: mucoidy inhibitor MuiA family protein [Chitinophagaceae bacterium]|nr:mucoidy inhibitor MuiA family protein [Chitinophagaceae bacterium]